ncbi:RNA polymerase sigma factor [compost metagenome]
MEISDKYLLEAIVNKDEKAFKLFYDRYAKLLLSSAFKRTGNKAISDDIVQNFWVIFWSKPESIKVDEHGTARKYLMHYFSYRMLDYLKSAAVRIIGDEKLLDATKNSARYSHVFEDLQVQEILDVIDEIILLLPETTKEIFQYIWENNYSVKEAAIHFNVSEKVIRNRYNTVLESVQAKVRVLKSDEQTLQNINTFIHMLLGYELFK